MADAIPTASEVSDGSNEFPLVFLRIVLIGPFCGHSAIGKLFDVAGRGENPSRDEIEANVQFSIFMAVNSTLNLLMPGVL